MQHIHTALLRALDLLGMGDCVNPKDRLNDLAERLEGEAGEELTPTLNGRVDQPKGLDDARLSLVGGFDGRHSEDGEAAKNSAMYALDLALQRDHSAQCVASYADFEKLTARLVQLRCVDAWFAGQMRKTPKVRREAVFAHLSPLFGLRLDKFWPNQMPVVWSKVTSCEFATALLFNASAVRHGDAIPPLVDGLLRKVEAPHQSGLKPATIKKVLP